MEGWKRVQPLPRPGGIAGRCFVAMWFADEMDEAFELGISRAVTDCGFPAPTRIDRKEHNNQITDEIMAAIRDAEFVVADFSGNRGGVYYEAVSHATWGVRLFIVVGSQISTAGTSTP